MSTAPATDIPGWRLLPRASRHVVPNMDRVPFTAACPQCGADCEWTAVRVDTRLGLSIYCDCP